MRTLFFTYVSLIALLALTLFVHGSALPWQGPIALLIAAAKALLIAWVFMELRSSTRVARLVASAALLWIFIFYLLSSLDFLFRPAIGTSTPR